MNAPALLAAVLVGSAVLLADAGAGRRLAAAREPLDATDGAAGAGVSGAAAGAWWWSRVRTAVRPPSESRVAVLMDVVAAAMSAGLPPARALETAAAALPGPTGDAVSRVAVLWMLGAAPHAAWEEAPAELEPLRRVLHLVATAGVPGVPLLHAAATELRRRERRRAQAHAEALAVRMVLPLGLCALPAFVAWAVVPVVLSLAQEVLR